MMSSASGRITPLGILIIGAATIDSADGRVGGDAPKPLLGLLRAPDRPTTTRVPPFILSRRSRKPAEPVGQAALALQRRPEPVRRRRRTGPPRTGCRGRSRTATGRSSASSPTASRGLVQPDVVDGRQRVRVAGRVLRPLLEPAPGVAARLLTDLVHVRRFCALAYHVHLHFPGEANDFVRHSAAESSRLAGDLSAPALPLAPRQVPRRDETGPAGFRNASERVVTPRGDRSSIDRSTAARRWSSDRARPAPSATDRSANPRSGWPRVRPGHTAPARRQKAKVRRSHASATSAPAPLRD